MPAAVAIPLSEYLGTSYRPDCDYLEGELLERNVGERDHSRLQTSLVWYLRGREKQLKITVLAEQRVQVRANRFRIPDITVIAGGLPPGPIVIEPPFLCIEILSPSDRITEMQERIDDYLAFGVQYIWLINPSTLHAWVYTPAEIQEARDGVLATENPEIRITLSELE
jgi:Uma2 family endonuclease